MPAQSLTQKTLQKLLHYDPLTGVFVWKVRPSYRVHVGDVAGTSGTTSGKQYRYIRINKKGYLVHRLAWLYQTGSFPPHEIDHADGNGLNNKFSNLSPATRFENGKNCRLQSTNTSGITGVVWDQINKKWYAQISINHKHIHLGAFATIFAAAYARHAADIKYGFHPNHGSNRPL